MRLNRRLLCTALVAVCTATTPVALATSASAAPATKTPVPGASAPTYTVLNGDSLWSISLKLKVPFPALLTANSLTPTSLILAGQQLVAPVGAVLPAAKPGKPVAATSSPAAQPAPAPLPAKFTTAPTSYTVVRGDYLYGIARNFAVPFTALLAANSFTISSAIFPGKAITIPAGATTTPKTAATTTVTPAPAAVANIAAVASPATPATTAAPAPPKIAIASTGNGKLDGVLAFALDQIGKPYVFAGAGPDSYDCSGLVLTAYKQAGVSLFHQSAVQSTQGTAVDWKTSPIKPGDLVFLAGAATPGIISHVGMAISASQWIQAPKPGSPVGLGTLPASEKIIAVRRFIDV